MRNRKQTLLATLVAMVVLVSAVVACGAATAASPEAALREFQPAAAWTPRPTNTPLPTWTPGPTSTPLPTWTPRGQSPAAPPTRAATPPAVGGAPIVRETTLTIMTYGYEAGFVPTGADDPVYPYPRLDFARVTPPQPRSYRAIVLENDWLTVTVLPELGGRVYQIVDRTTGRALLYNNPVIKPTSWGYRGWWLAAGGIEWALPVEEHGLNEYRPWRAQIGPGSVRVWDRDDRTGLEVGVTIALTADRAALRLTPYVRNPSAQPLRLHFWLNAMVALNANTTTPQTRIILPAGAVRVHSTGDSRAPAAAAALTWPLHNGVDYSTIGNWDGWLGFFAAPSGFAAIYDPTIDQGIVRVQTPNWPRGVKLFGPGTLAPSLWTDGETRYLELWGGLSADFWTPAQLAAGQATGWTEYWAPLHGLGGLSAANAQVAAHVQPGAAGATLAVYALSALDGEVHLLANGRLLARWPVTLAAGATWRMVVPDAPLHGLTLRVLPAGAPPLEVAPLP